MSTSSLTLLALMAGLSLLPFVLVMCTSFVRMAVVLSILRSALGAGQVPPASVITGLALVLSLVAMSPVAAQMGERFEESWPRLQQAEPAELFREGARVVEPLSDFLRRHTDPERLREFARLLGDDVEAPGWRSLVPAYAVGQLEQAFRTGFVLFLPFLVLDLLVGSILLSLGMHMLSPAGVSLPFKLLLFVAADGWNLLGANLLASAGA
jgi:type III secretion protein R